MLFSLSFVSALFLGASAVYTPRDTAATRACLAIRVLLGPTIVETSGPEYDATAHGTWSLFNSIEQPTCIVYPRTAAHVQTAMRRIFKAEANYAVQSGAHSAMVGWNSITDGVLISTAHMKNVSYSLATDTITVQPGVHWAEIMDAVEPFGVAAIGGRASDIGTGILIGGGISFVSPLYGWSADSIKEMDVVLVNGRLVTATVNNQYSDLFKALKGGANRFGIVTRYELYSAHTGTKNDKNWYGGIINYSGAHSVAVATASANYIRDVVDPKAALIVLMNTVDTSAADANIIYLFYKGTSLPPSIFGEFLAIPSTSQTLSPLSYFEISNLIPGNGRGFGQQFGSSSLIGDNAHFQDAYSHLVNFTSSFPGQLAGAYLIISPVPKTQFDVSQARGGNAMGDVNVNYASLNYNLIYPEGVTTIPANVNTGFKLLLSQVPRTPGLPLYVNECDVSQNVFSTYTGTAYATLKNTYNKYDPSRFNVRHTVGPIGL
ncbi:FAD-binding domain-containing protein [Mycena rebaudengoi]|nr:FAD-binding domain-containing protein [Mycena rebaudengoi]